METLVTFLLTGSLIQGVFCEFSINLPKKVEALQGSCVFIPCTFDVDKKHENDLTDRAKRIWYKGDPYSVVFDSSSPDTKLFKGEILGTATQKNCSTRFDNVNQNHNGSYFFRLEDDKLKYSFKKNPLLQIVVSGSPPKPTLSVFKDQQEVMKMEEVMEESSLSLRCSTKIFCPSRPPSLTWTSSLNENITGQQYQSQSELVSDLNFTVSHRLHKVTFTCTATHQLQRNITTQRSRMIRVQYAPTNTSVRINPAGLVLEGRSVTLICSSDANPAVNYTWYRDPEELLNPVQTGPNLTLNNPDPTDRGLYYCRADNKHGSHNTSVLLDVQYAPTNTSVRINPAGLVLEGRSVTLICSSDANPAVNYTWYRDPEELLNPVQTEPNLTLNNPDPTDRGLYYCRADNKHGSHNTSVLLDVQYAPTNTSVRINPAGLVLEGRSVTLICSCDANPAVNYTWYRDPEELLNPVQTGPNLTLNNPDPTDRGLYYCRADNKHGSHNTSVLLDVQYAPTNTSVRINPAGLVLEGRSVTLICSSDANPAVNYTWYRDPEELLNPVQTGPNLTLNNPDPTDRGLYYCRADNKHGSQNTSMLLDVQYAPTNTSVRINPAGLVLEGRSVTLICSSDANPAVNYTWYRDPEELLNPVQTGPNLTLNNPDPTDRGLYYCRADNKHGSHNTSVLLDVQYAPTNTSVRINPAGLVLEGRSVTLICSSDANPAVNYTWYRDPEELLNPVQTGPNLTLNNPDPTDRGLYYCRADNKHGSHNTSVLLDVQYAPKNTSLSAFPSSSVMEGKPVTLNCRTDSNPAELNYTWYRETGSQFEFLQTGYNHTYTVTNPSHNAWYGCNAQNQHGQCNATVQLDVQFMPKVNSSCSRNSVMSCVCEAHGNPCPTLEWRLSGHALTNSTETPISEEKLGSTGVKSVLTLRQSLSDTDVLQCFSSNVYGSASQQFQPISSTQETSFHPLSVLLGAAVGAAVMIILCIMMLCYERRRKEKPSESRQDDTSGLILTQIAVALDHDIQFVHADNGMLSSTAPSEPQSLHYSSIDFSNTEAPSGEIRGMASLTSEYATIRHRPEEAADPENTTEPKQEEDMTAEITDTSSPASEDVIYGNMSHHHRQKEPLVTADDAEKID
ncbi:myelin-associated glycoprotein-like [Puntigrus tetrazona]|uniref:myelin-associated glycoprotein-like n=1 Tax=Puntigrus tetrazona TaxID=1606681 RepID=UPI001C89E6D8|nr:myelin-associated glycoprotein-like [Puntigrus tetrazona]